VPELSETERATAKPKDEEIVLTVHQENVLAAALPRSGVTRETLTRGSGLEPRLLGKTVNALMRRNLLTVEEVRGSERFFLTERGRRKVQT
jgi:hypothetical protein